MIRRAAWMVALGLWAFAMPVAAQTQAETVQGIGPAIDALAAQERTDEETFARLALRAEDLAARDDASLFAIGRLRADLVRWRDEFLARTSLNAGRIETVDAQLAALGSVPEDGVEPASVAARRAELIAQRLELRAPGLLADEAHARANGLIAEFDAIVQSREAAQLGIRSPSPLNPGYMFAAVTTVVSLFEVIGVELTAGISLMLTGDGWHRDLPRFFILLGVGLALMSMGRRITTGWRNSLPLRAGRLGVLQSFALSLVQIIVPTLGLFAVTRALEGLGVFGLRGSDLLDALPLAGVVIIFGWWLARQIFPEDERLSFLGHTADVRASGRRIAAAVVWVLAISRLIDAGLRTIDTSDGTNSALSFIPIAVLGYLFWRFAKIIGTQPPDAEDPEAPRGRKRALVARACRFIAILSPALAALGFVEAAGRLLVPAIMSVGLIGLVMLMQRLATLLSPSVADQEDNRGLYALLPVMITVILFMLSLPLFALIWGASPDDLIEIWSRFREGFTIGETTLSPTDFLRFAVVFVVGYLLTRFFQGALRKSVLPRTRLDIGGQNAIVAGFGYVGILLAAIIAITSAGLDLSNIAIVAGALSVGIGFGLQNIVSNFVSGIILLIERPVSEGDWIEVSGQMGYVRSISVRSTRIETFDRTDVIIPNADLVSGQVTNWTRGNLIGRVIVPVGVAYGTDVEKVTGILRGIAEAHPMVVVTPPPSILFVGFGADSLDFEIRAILRDVNYVMIAKSEMNYEIAKQFAEAGIEIPFAQRDVWLRNPEALKGDA